MTARRRVERVEPMPAANISPARQPTIAIDVRPPLLASTIIRLLRRDDVAIVDLTNEPAGATDAEYDVVVTADADDGPAHLRLVLAPDGAGASEEPSVIDLRRVTELVSPIDLWRAARSEPAPG
ncbi:MAG TPA: hypothetical protein VIR58_20375 [Acidimicrobiales bacterium]